MTESKQDEALRMRKAVEVYNMNIEKLEAFSKAAKTPWSVQSKGDWWVVNDSLPSSLRDPVVFDDGSAAGEYGPRCSEETRDYIVALANAAPALIAEVRRLRAIEAAAQASMQQIDRTLWLEHETGFLHDLRNNARICDLRAALAAKET